MYIPPPPKPPPPSPLCDEMTKQSYIEKKHVREGTPVYSSLAEIQKKMRPGDIIATKTNDQTWNKTNLVDYATVKTVELLGGSPWSHIALYKGKGDTIHTSPKNSPVPRVEDDNLKDMVGAGRDFLVLRPTNTSPKEQAKSIKRMESIMGTGYSYGDIASVFAPWIVSSEKEYEGKPSGAICTHTAAWANPKLKFDRPIRSLAPRHFVNHDKLRHVAAYSEDKRASAQTSTHEEILDMLPDSLTKTAERQKTAYGIGGVGAAGIGGIGGSLLGGYAAMRQGESFGTGAGAGGMAGGVYGGLGGMAGYRVAQHQNLRLGQAIQHGAAATSVLVGGFMGHMAAQDAIKQRGLAERQQAELQDRRGRLARVAEGLANARGFLQAQFSPKAVPAR